MKKMTLILVATLMAACAFAQHGNDAPTKRTKKRDPMARPNKCPSLYLGTSTGVNNNTGLLSVMIDLPIEKNISVDGGVGISSWGTKLYVGGKYYLQSCHRGWAFGTGVTYNSGLEHFQQNMETIYGTTETVEMNLNAQTNILFAAYKYWSLGKRYNRVYLQMGWSVPLSGGRKYDQTYGTPISDRSDATIKLISPGGPIVAVGFSFGVAH